MKKLSLLLVFLFLAGCGKIEHYKANARIWQTFEYLYEYRRVQSGEICIPNGKYAPICIPQYISKWVVVETATRSDTTDTPLPPNKFDYPRDCSPSPNLGDNCVGEGETRYYLNFDVGAVSVPYEIWLGWEPNNEYSLRKILGIYTFVGE